MCETMTSHCTLWQKQVVGWLQSEYESFKPTNHITELMPVTGYRQRCSSSKNCVALICTPPFCVSDSIMYLQCSRKLISHIYCNCSMSQVMELFPFLVVLCQTLWMVTIYNDLVWSENYNYFLVLRTSQCGINIIVGLFQQQSGVLGDIPVPSNTPGN